LQKGGEGASHEMDVSRDGFHAVDSILLSGKYKTRLRAEPRLEA